MQKCCMPHHSRSSCAFRIRTDLNRNENSAFDAVDTHWLSTNHLPDSVIWHCGTWLDAFHMHPVETKYVDIFDSEKPSKVIESNKICEARRNAWCKWRINVSISMFSFPGKWWRLFRAANVHGSNLNRLQMKRGAIENQVVGFNFNTHFYTQRRPITSSPLRYLACQITEWAQLEDSGI